MTRSDARGRSSGTTRGGKDVVAMATRRSSSVWPSGDPVVPSFGENRLCLFLDCATRLSRYNPEEYCFVHRDQIPLRRIVRQRRR
jgi:hypothetical protein